MQDSTFLTILFVCFILCVHAQSYDSIPPDSIYTSDDSLSALNDSLKKDTLKGFKISKNAIEVQIPYKAKDSIRFLVKEQKVFLYGDAVVKYGTIELSAAYIEIDLSKNLVFATGVKDSTGKETGKPVFKDGTDEFQARTMQYNFRTEKGLIKGVISEQAGGYLHGEVTKKQENDEIHIKSGKYTTCNLEHPHFYINLTKAKVIPNDKIITGPANLVVEDLPTPLFIPFGYFPNQEKHKSGIIIPEYGEESNRGFYLRNGGYYLPLGDFADVTFLGDVYSRRSWAASLKSNYKLRYKFNGNVDFRYNVNYLEDTVNNNGYAIQWRHSQDPKAMPNSNFTASVDFRSSSYNRNNAYSIERRMENITQSSISYRKTFANTPFNLSTNLNHSQNFTDSTINLRLPVINLSVNKIYPLKLKGSSGKKWYEKIGVSYNGAFSNNITTKEAELYSGNAMDKFKNGINHNADINTSFNLLKYIMVSPYLNFNDRMYFKRIVKPGLVISNGDTLSTAADIDTISKFCNSWDYDVGTTMNTKIYGLYQFRQDDPVKGMMHVITPNISLSYRPDFGKIKFGNYDSAVVAYDSIYSNNQFIGFDTVRQLYDPYQGFIYQNAPTGKSGMISFGLNNTLEMKVRSSKDTASEYKKIRILDALSFKTGYNLAADSLNWSPLSTSARTKLFGKVNVIASASLNPYAIDTLGRIINTFEWEKEKNPASFINPGGKFKYGRLTSATVSFDMSFKSKQGDKKKEQKTDLLPANYLDYYVDFEIPWNMSISYSLSYSKSFILAEQKYQDNTTQTIRFNGDLNLTNKWKIGFSSGYDFQNKKITTTTIDIYRDLHCWEMSFNWIPFGNYLSYNFTIKAKSSILQDLKLNKKRSWYDNF
ncbi:MAG: LPS-assembly protein LptD [Bacteroidia bacterium]|nr:LPS-assembly protein LptD [Bacteroidia bacterium]